jgi:hypothetical protein
MIGVRADGRKELVVLADGYREATSERRPLEEGDLRVVRQLAVGGGARHDERELVGELAGEGADHDRRAQIGLFPADLRVEVGPPHRPRCNLAGHSFDGRSRPTSLTAPDRSSLHPDPGERNRLRHLALRERRRRNSVRVHGSMISNDGDIATRWCLEGHG